MVVAYIRFLVGADGASFNSSDTDTSNVFAVVDRGNEKLKLAVLISLGSRNIVKYLREEGNEVGTLYVGILGSCTRSARAVKHRTVELLVGCVEVDEKLKYLILNLAKTCVGLVYLVNNYNNSVVKFKSSLKNESGLGHRSLCRVNEKNNSVNHFEDTLNLAAEVSVAGGVNEVYLNVLVVYRGVFCKNSNSSFLFKVTGVHNAGNGLLVFSVYTALLEHLVYESGFSVVNVCNYCYVS